MIILQLDNNETLEASLQNSNATYEEFSLAQLEPKKEPHEYDDQGALLYVIVVLCMYAFSIILMIGSSIKKSKQDRGVSKYMKGMDKLRSIQRRQEKFKARMVFHNNKLLAKVLERSNSGRYSVESPDIIKEESESELVSMENSIEEGENEETSQCSTTGENQDVQKLLFTKATEEDTCSHGSRVHENNAHKEQTSFSNLTEDGDCSEASSEGPSCAVKCLENVQIHQGADQEEANQNDTFELCVDETVTSGYVVADSTGSIQVWTEA